MNSRAQQAKTNTKTMPKRERKLRYSLPAAIPAGAQLMPVTEPTPTTQWVTVTPELAMKWLDEANINNRKVREDHVARLAADMLAGKWRGRNGEPMKFDRNGRMFEGQHRCWACVQSGKSFETLLLTDCDPEAYETSGIGRPKNYGDFLGPVDHEKNVYLLAATIRLVWIWQQGKLGSPIKSDYTSVAQLKATFQAHPHIRESANWVTNAIETRRLLTSSFAALIHYAGTLEGKQTMVENFLERLGNGLGLAPDDPVYQLRKFLLSQRGPQRGLRRAGNVYVLALAIKAWNACKEERPMRQLAFRIDEEFPKL